MELALSDDQMDLQAAVRAVLDREQPVELCRRVIESRPRGVAPEALKAVDELWTRMVELDWPALMIAEADGGVGLGMLELALVAEELGRALTPGPWLSTTTQFAPVVMVAGDADQRARFLGAVAGGLTGALAIAEGHAWAAAGATTMTPIDGDRWKLDGAKQWVLGADAAVELALVARDTRSDEAVVAVVPIDVDGLTLTATDCLDASRGMATVAFDGVVVPSDRMLTSAAPAPALEQATVALAAEIVGVCQGILDIVLAHVGSREQFGVKIGSFQAVKHKLANMYVAVESARALVRFAAAAIDEGDDRRTLATSMAKASAGDCQRLLAVEGIQCLGGIGYTWEHDMHIYVKRAKTDAAMFGTGAEHRSRVADLIGL